MKRLLTSPSAVRPPGRLWPAWGRWCLALLSSAHALCAAVDAPRGYLLRNWTTADGLPDNTVRAIVETRDGYLWMGTANGLVRFDGIRFTTFDPANTPGLPTADVYGLTRDLQDGLWLTTRRGVLRYHDGKFTPMPRPQDGLQGGVFNIVADARGNVWMRSHTNLVRWTGERLEIAQPWPGGPESVHRITSASDGGLWFAARNGLWRVRDTKAELIAPGSAPELLAQGRDGRLWAIRGEAQLGLLEKEGWKAVAELPVRCRTLWVSSNNDVWLGADSAGRAFRWRQGELLEIGPAQGLQGNRAIDFAEDREGNIWLGMNGAGLYRLREKRLGVFDQQYGFGNTAMASVVEDAHGGIFASCMGHGAYRMGGERFEPLLPGIGNTSNRLTTALAPAASGGTWVGMFYDELPRIVDGRVVERIGSGSGTRSLLVDRTGDLWRGTRSAGVEHFSGSNVTRYAVSNGLSFNNVYSLAEDREGAIWAGTEEGLNRIHKGRITQFGRTDGLGHHFITTLCVDSRGTLWAGTLGGGLSGRTGGRFVTITVNDGLADDAVQQLIEDDLGNIWVGTRAGLMRVPVTMLHDFLNGRTRAIYGALVGRSEGLVRPSCWTEYQPAGIKARDGRLWICTGSGLVLIDPRRFDAPVPPPVVHIEEVKLDADPPMEVHGGIDSLEMPARAERLQVRYTGISPSDPELVRFRYRLVGYDRDWIEAGRVRFAHYAHVTPGGYQFEVQALNNHGVWSKPAVLGLQVRPAYWQTAWFRGAVVLGTIGVLFAGYRGRVARLERRRADQEAFARRLIDSQEQDRRRIASELHDGLGQDLIVIKNRAALALTQMTASGPATAHLEEVSHMASAALQEVRAIAQNLRPYQIDQFGLTKAIASMVNQLAESSGIEFNCDLEPIDDALPAGLDIGFYRIAQECVNNVVKHSQARRATLQVRRNARTVNLTVTDEGCGFAPNPSGPPSGIGLRNIVERARAMRGDANIHSSPGRGTRVEVVIPVKAS